MPLRRRVWLPREGLYYLAVLAFIVGGAVLRNVNLLVILAGMMVAPLLLNWRLVLAALRGLEIHRRLPSQAHASEPFTVEIAVTNHRRWFSSWLVRVEDRLERLGRPDAFGNVNRPSKTGWDPWITHWRTALAPVLPSLVPADRPEVFVLEAAAGTTSNTTYQLTIPRRGRYRFGPLTIGTGFPLGLVRGQIVVPDEAELAVLPRLGRLLPRWAELTEAEPIGDQRRNPQQGIAEGDYYGLRPWQTGDSQRWIHWRTTAKLNAPTVRQFERQQSNDVAIVLDPWLPEFITEEDIGQLEMAISLTATIVADLCQRGFGRLSVALATSTPVAWVAPASPLVRDEILNALTAIEGGQSPPLAPAIEKLAQPLATGCRLIVVSPRSQTSALTNAATGGTDPVADAANIHWIDVSGPEVAEFFSLD